MVTFLKTEHLFHSNILFKDAQTSDTGKLNDWIDRNIGPLPAEKMPERVVAIIDEMIVPPKTSVTLLQTSSVD